MLYPVGFAEIKALHSSGQWREAGELPGAAVRRLEAAAVEVLVLCANTMHKVADQVQAAIAVPLLHMGDATADAVTASGVRRVGLLGTAFTMEQDFYRDRLTRHGLDVVVPPPDDRAQVHRVNYELRLGIVQDASRAAYRDVISRLVDQGAQGIILGCTEIELLIGAADSPVPVVPTTSLLVEAAIETALAGREPGDVEDAETTVVP